jgi:hypothetical protein
MARAPNQGSIIGGLQKTRTFRPIGFSRATLDRIRSGPRPAPAKTKNTSEAVRKNREAKAAIRERIRMFSASRDLAPEDIKAAMTTKHFDLVQFAEKYSVSIERLIIGKGRIAAGRSEPA